MGILSGNPKQEPMHYGEIFDVWSFSLAANHSLACYQVFEHHAGDQDLKALIKDLKEQAQKEIRECNELLKQNEIAPPPSLPEKPEAKLADIPAGARFSDPEISAAVSAEVAAGLVLCSQIMAKSIREDISAMFGKYHTAKAALSLRALRLNKEKGWLVPPPLHTRELAKV